MNMNRRRVYRSVPQNNLKLIYVNNDDPENFKEGIKPDIPEEYKDIVTDYDIKDIINGFKEMKREDKNTPDESMPNSVFRCYKPIKKISDDEYHSIVRIKLIFDHGTHNVKYEYIILTPNHTVESIKTLYKYKFRFF